MSESLPIKVNSLRGLQRDIAKREQIRSVTQFKSKNWFRQINTSKEISLPDDFSLTSIKLDNNIEAIDVKEFWSRVYLEDRLTLESIIPFIYRSAWRIVRELCRYKGILQESESLGELFQPNSDPWNMPICGSQPNRLRYTGSYLDCKEMINVIGLLPPGIPDEWTGKKEYNPDKNDPILRLYVDCLENIAYYLGIDKGSKSYPQQGQYSLKYLTNLNTIRLAFPSKYQLLAFEELLISEVLKRLISDQLHEIKDWLKNEFGFIKHEIECIIDVAKTSAKNRLTRDIESERGLIILRLEDILKRSKEALDLRAEIGCIKAMSQILGIVRQGPENTMDELKDIIDRVASKQDQKIIDTDYTVVEDEQI